MASGAGTGGPGDDGSDPRDGMNDPLPEGFDPSSVNLEDASEDLLWKVLPHTEGSRRAETLYVLGSRLARNERWEQAVVCAEESVSEWESAGNSTGLVHGLLAAATCRSQLEDHGAAIGHYLRGIELLETYGPESELAEALGRLGGVYIDAEQLPEALDCLRRSLGLIEQWELPAETGALHQRIAHVLHRIDAPSQAVLDELLAARSDFALAKDLGQVMDANDQLARHFDAQGDFETAAIYLEENLHLAKSIGRSEVLGVAHYRYAGALRLSDRHEEAFLHIEAARGHLRDANDHERMLWCDLEQVWCLQRAGRTREAIELLETLWVAVRIVGSSHEVHAVINDLYPDAIARGEVDIRERLCRQALVWGEEHEDEALVDRYTIELGLVHLDAGRYVDAESLLEHSSEKDGHQPAFRTIETDALLQSGLAELSLHRGDAASAAMALAGVSTDSPISAHVLARIHRTRGLINEALVKGSGVADLATAAQIWTNLGWRHEVAATLARLTGTDPAAE